MSPISTLGVEQFPILIFSCDIINCTCYYSDVSTSQISSTSYPMTVTVFTPSMMIDPGLLTMSTCVVEVELMSSNCPTHLLNTGIFSVCVYHPHCCTISDS